MVLAKNKGSYDTKPPPVKFQLGEPVDRNTPLREMWQHKDTDFVLYGEPLAPDVDTDPGLVIFHSEEQDDVPRAGFVEHIRKQSIDSMHAVWITSARRISATALSKTFTLAAINEPWNTAGNLGLASEPYIPFVRDYERQTLMLDLQSRKEGPPVGYITIRHGPIVDKTPLGSRHPRSLQLNKAGVQKWPLSPSSVLTLKVLDEPASEGVPSSDLHPIALEFSKGITSSIPNPDVVSLVDRIIRSVLEKTQGAEYSVDEDGAFSFEAMLASGLFIMCEISLLGNINAGLYQGADGDLHCFLTRPTEEELLDLF